MEYEDRIAISTPEGVEIELALAGLGSRFLARVIDTVFEFLVVFAGIALIGALFAVLESGEPSGWEVAVRILLIVLVVIAYDVLFETLAGGRTLGKRWTGLRVVRTGGQPVGLRTSFVRNVLRILEGPALLYAPAMIAILATGRNQRLGDLAAGTLVVRDRSAAAAAPSAPAGYDVEAAKAWDVSGVGADDLATVQRFLMRRRDLTDGARSRLADRLATRLRAGVAGAPEDLPPEQFLEGVVAAKSTRG